MNAIEKKLNKAFVQLLLIHPFFGYVAMRLERKIDDTHSTAATDGTTMWFSPKFLEALTIPQIMTLIGHEILHIILMHHLRQGARQDDAWNYACDFALDPLLAESGFDTTIPMIHIDAKYKGMNAEQIYASLPERSCSFQEGMGKVLRSKGKTTELEVKQMIMEASIVAEQCGKTPKFIERLISETLTPTRNWRDELQDFLTEREMAGCSWNRANRRYVAQNIYLPGRNHITTGELVMVVDTSGSIGERELNAMANEIKAANRLIQPKSLIVIYCDTAVNRVDIFEREDEIVIRNVGGGGTSFFPPFAYLERENIVPHALVYLTDGYGDGFPNPQFPVLWAINNDHVVPPTGRHIRVHADEND